MGYNIFGTTNTFEGSSGGGGGTGTTPNPITLPQVIAGAKRATINRQFMFDRPAEMTEAEEYWPCFVDMRNVQGWNASKYPAAIYSSTDHASGVGGIFVRLLCPELSEFTDPHDILYDRNAWIEYTDAVTADPTSFSHITAKSNPIFIGAGKQTETPQVIVHGGSVHIYFHENGGLNVPNNPQGSRYGVNTNGIDFNGTARTAEFAFDPAYRQGNGHTGYTEAGLNVMDSVINPVTGLPYTWMGQSLAGGKNDGYQLLAGDALGELELIEYIRRPDSELMKFNTVGQSDYVYPISQPQHAIKEGAYYRVPYMYRPPSGGGADNDGGLCEVLVDSDFTPVAEPNFYGMPIDGTFDESGILHMKEFVWHGRRYAFYKTVAIDPDGPDYSKIGLTEIVTQAHNWNVFNPLSNKSVSFTTTSNGTVIAPNVTYSETAVPYVHTDGGSVGLSRNFTRVLLPQNGDVSTALVNSNINLLDNDVTDIRFDNIGKENLEPILLEFGVTDNISTPTREVAIVFNPRTDPDATAESEEMLSKTTGLTADYDDSAVGELYGQSSNWKDLGNDESVYCKHNLTLRFIPAQNRVIVMSGASHISEHPLTGFDYSAILKPFIRANFTSSEQSADGHVAFTSITVKTYSADAIEVPDAPTLTTAKTENSITLTASAVTGATGYKYYLNAIEQDNGVFTGLEPDTEYTVYARAVGANGDSPPSTITTVTTDAAPNTLPTLQITGDTTATAGDTVDLTAIITDPDTGDTLSIDWTVSEGIATLSNESVIGASVTKIDGGSVTVQGVPSDGTGNGQAVTHTIVFSAAQVVLPILQLSANTVNATAGQTITFTATPTNADTVTFESDDVELLGTGNTRTAVMPALADANQVNVTATATNAQGTVSDNVVVNVAAFQQNAFDNYNRETLYVYIPSCKAKIKTSTKALLTNVSYKFTIVINDGHIKGSQFSALKLQFYKSNERTPFLILTEDNGLAHIGSFIEATILDIDQTLGSQIYVELSDKGNTSAFIASWYFDLINTRN